MLLAPEEKSSCHTGRAAGYERSMDKTVLITGATSGIGKATALELARRGYAVEFTTRDPAKGAAVRNEIVKATGNEKVRSWDCDLASFDSIRTFSRGFSAEVGRLDVLLNNAGVYERTRQESADNIELTWAVNFLAPFLLTDLLLELLKTSAPARIINVSSNAHWNGHIDFEDPEFKQKYRASQAYAQSKLANILHIKELAGLLEGSQVTANALHPGVINTPLLRAMLGLASGAFPKPDKGARTPVYVATAPEIVEVSGEYFDNSHVSESSPESKNPLIAERLWQLAEDYLRESAA